MKLFQGLCRILLEWKNATHFWQAVEYFVRVFARIYIESRKHYGILVDASLHMKNYAFREGFKFIYSSSQQGLRWCYIYTS